MRAAEDASAGGGNSSSNSRSAAVSAIELVFGRLVAAGTVGGWEEAKEAAKEEEGEPRATLGLGSPPPPAQGYLICLGNRYFQRGTQEGRRARLEGHHRDPLAAAAFLRGTSAEAARDASLLLPGCGC